MAGDVEAACAAINRILDLVVDEIRAIIKGDVAIPELVSHEGAAR